MMDHGQPPDQKRQRVDPWHNNPPKERQTDRPLLPPLRSPYPHEGGSPFSARPENPLNPRRHSEHQGTYDSDPRRPNSGPHSAPSHQYLPHHSHSAPPNTAPPYVPPAIMKRESGEDQQYNRPPSRGNGPEHNTGTHPYGTLPPFEGPGPSQPSNAVPFRHTGGYGPPHSPMTGNESFQQPSFGASPHQAQRGEMYPGLSYPPQGNLVKKKAQRASQACDSCRSLKAKCDEGRPSCSTCKEKGALCVYRDPPPKQQDKTQTDILDGMLEMKGLIRDHMAMMTELVGTLARRVDRIEQDIKQPSATPIPNLKDEQQPISMQHVAEFVTKPTPPDDTVVSKRNASESIGDTPTPESAAIRADEEADEEAGEPVNPGPSSIPVNHTTGAARLLLEKPIADLARDAKPLFVGTDSTFEKFPMLYEEKRGVLRAYGRGEGVDRPPGYDKDPLIDYASEGTPSDTASDPATPPPGEEWGQIGGLTPPHDDAPISRYGEDSRLGLGVDSEGLPDLSPEAVHRFADSYLKNINIMHPILMPRRLAALIEVFLKSIPESHAKPKPPPAERVSAGFLSSRGLDSPGKKRKILHVTPVETIESHGTWGHKPGHPFRSISTALVLLVMALGSICLHKEKIPDVVSDKDNEDAESASPASRNGLPRSPLVTGTTGLPSPHERDRTAPPSSRSRRTSLDGQPARPGTNLKLKNLDVIPGLSYFAIATDIIGNQIGGNSLQHVHVNILAGLYHGQLGRILESNAYIANACRALQVILRPKLDRFKKLKEKGVTVQARDNPLVFAFWTCLQLESDIVAELPVPMSGILTYEDSMPLPFMRAAVDEDFFDDVQIKSYITQLNLRRHLNQLHTMFYNPDESSGDQKTKSYWNTLEAVQKNLDMIRSFAPPALQWNDTDPPATDILGARLRAKYYGAEVLTYRSFVLKTMNKSSGSSPPGVVLGEFKDNIVPTSHSSEREDNERDLRYAQRCIQALIRSTTAFHGLGDPTKERLIVTNVWGTVHAQWGNVLTLLTAYKDPILNEYIDKDVLRSLYKKTLSVLDLHMQPSSALALDWKILRHVARQTDIVEKQPKVLQYASTSFGSNSSGDVPMSGY